MEILIAPLLHVLLIVVDLYTWVVLIGVVLSWLIAFNIVNTHNKFVFAFGDLVRNITEPVLIPIRRILPNLGNVDFSPMVLILGLIFIKGVIQKLFLSIG